MGLFDELFDDKSSQEQLEIGREQLKKKQEDLTLQSRGHFLKISSKHRIKINKATNFTEKYKVAMELIRDLTGDELFYITHIKDIGSIPEDNEQIRKVMAEAVIVDTTRRVNIHYHMLEQDKTALNEFLYESSLIDLELLAMEKKNFKSDEDYEQAMENKMLEKQSLIDIYRLSVAKRADNNDL